MKIFYLFILTVCISLLANSQNQNIIIDNSFPYNVNQQTLGATIGGDTIFISSSRTNPLKFQNTNGDSQNHW
jgi:hypothetical protein